MAGIFDPGIFDSGIFDTPAGGTTYNRTAADSLSTLTESVSRVATYARTVSDSLSAITEAVVASTNVLTRTVADSISTLTESVTKAATFPRSVATSLATLTETVVKVVAHPRTVADSLSAITEAVVRVKAVHRTVADSISSLTATVARIGTTARSLGDLLPSIGNRVAVTLPYNPNVPPYSPVEPPYFDLTIGDVPVLTDPTVIASMHFEAQVNGVAGTCKFRVRDDESTHSFTVGQEIVLTISGRTEWRGFVVKINRVYAFPALNVVEFGPTRFFDIEGSDINILLQKRIVFNQSTPANITAPLLPPHTADTTAIAQLFASWLDLSGDGINTVDWVDSVGDTTWTQEGRAWEGSDTWGQAMQSIASLPAAIYYIDPDRNFVYTDVDTPNAPFALSDQPNGVTSFGYREMEILADGTGLANDVMAIGIGYGSQTPVFVRDEDATSIATHGRWQQWTTAFGVYLQTTIDRIASSIIDGSPQSKRGAKNDRPAVMVVTHQPGLRVGEKVDFSSEVFGYNDVIPIRKMEIEFDGPSAPRYTLVLSHEIDTPFGFFDPFPPFPFPQFKPPKFCPPGYFKNAIGNCVPIVIPGPTGCQDCDVTTVFDNFTRTMPTGWGNATPGGLAYSTSILNGTWSVNGTQGIVVVNAGTLNIVGVQSTRDPAAPWMPTTGWTMSTSFTMTEAAALGRMTIGVRDIQFGTYSMFARLSYDDQTLEDQDGNTVSMTLVSGVKYNLRWFLQWGPVAATKYWKIKAWQDGTAEPDWMMAGAGGTGYINSDGALFMSVTNANPSATATGAWDEIDFSTDRCEAPQFEDFQRTEASGWGTSTPGGYAWTVTNTGNGVGTTQVNPGYGRATLNGSAVRGFMSPTVGPWETTTGFVMTFSFRTSKFGPIIEVFDQDFLLDLYIYVNTSGGFVEMANTFGDDDFVSKTDWAINTTYNVKMEYTPGTVLRAKVWQLGVAEPSSWLVSINGATPVVTAMSIKISNNPGASAVVDIGPIDFDYTGKPCYLDCTTTWTILDDFTRTVAPRAWDRNSVPGPTNAWGQWTFSGWSGTSTSSASVNGSQGILVGGHEPGGNSNGVSVALTGTYPSGTWPQADGNFSARVTFQLDNNSTGSPFIEFRFGSLTPNQINMTFQHGTGSKFAEISRSGFSGFPQQVLSSIATGVDYIFEMIYNQSIGLHKARVYLASDPVPDWTMSRNSSSDSATVGDGMVIIATPAGGGAPDTTYAFDLIETGETNCADVPPGPGGAANSWVCEDFSPATTVMHTSFQYLGNSPAVWINGLLQPQSTYTMDGETTITLDTPPSPGDVARICYWALFLAVG